MNQIINITNKLSSMKESGMKISKLFYSFTLQF